MLSGVNKQETGGGLTGAESHSGEIACYGLSCHAGLIYHTRKRKRRCLFSSEIIMKVRFEVGGEAQQSDGIHLSGAVNTSAFCGSISGKHAALNSWEQQPM